MSISRKSIFIHYLNVGTKSYNVFISNTESNFLNQKNMGSIFRTSSSWYTKYILGPAIYPHNEAELYLYTKYASGNIWSQFIIIFYWVVEIDSL